jgi:hypothetical protein
VPFVKRCVPLTFFVFLRCPDVSLSSLTCLPIMRRSSAPSCCVAPDRAPRGVVQAPTAAIEHG